MAHQGVDLPQGLRDAIDHLCDEAEKAGWLVWIPQETDGIIDGFVCGNERFLKRVGIGLHTTQETSPEPKEQSH